MLRGDFVYTSFTQKYKKVEDLVGLTDLNLTPYEGFELRQLYDFNELSDHLKYLVSLNISNNYLSKLTLKNFIRLSFLTANSNMIGECNLVLPRLRKLNLSSNMLKKVPLLIFTPELVELNLSKNLIDKVTIGDLNPVKKTLEVLNLSFNRINFDSVNDFISLADGLKFYNLKDFSIQGNKFIESNQILANSYKTLLVLALKQLVTLNGETRNLTNDLVNEEEIKQQMLYEQNYFNKNKKAFYNQFSQIYFDKEKNKHLIELKMTPLESFLLTDIEDLNAQGSDLKKLISLNISENLLRKIAIGKKKGDFPNLKTIKASMNRIEVVEMAHLNSLSEIDLSNNNLHSIPDFTNVTGGVKVLILSSNKITDINFDNFLNFGNLRKLKLSNNLIDFENENFIENEVCVRFGEFRELKSIRLEENPFCQKPELYDYLFQEMSLYLYSEKKPVKLNGIPLSSIPPGQVAKLKINLSESRSIVSKTETKKEEEKKEKSSKVQKGKYEAYFSSLNYTLERLILFNGDNQVLYFDFLSEINELLELTEIIPENEKDKVNQLYKHFLMKCNEFLSLNQNYEAQIIKTLAQLSLIPNLGVCRVTLEFLKIYVESNEDKKVIIKSIFEEIIIKDLQLNNNIPFDMITTLIGFFKDTGISSTLLYKNLILNIVSFVVSFDEEQKTEKLEGKEAEDFLNSLNFIIEYLQDFNLEQISSPEETVKHRSVDDENNLSMDITNDKTDNQLITDFAFFEGLDRFEKKKGLDIDNSNLNAVSALKKQLNIYQNLLLMGGKRNETLFGNDLLSQIANDKNITKMRLLTESERHNYENIIYFYVFLNSYRSAYSYLINIQNYFSSFKNNDQTYQMQLAKFYKQIELMVALLTTYNKDKFPNSEILKNIDIKSIINSLDTFVSKFLVKKEGNPNYQKLIAKNVFQQSTSITSEVKGMIKLFFKGIPDIMDCIGALIAFLPERDFSSLIEYDLLDKYYLLMTHNKTDPMILIGACKLINHVLESSYLETNELSITKIFTKANFFTGLLNYIDYTKTQYRYVIDYLSALEDKKGSLIKDKEQVENPYDFNVLNSQPVFDFFISVIDIFVSISKYNFEESKQIQYILDKLSSVKMHDILGNCLQIVHNDEIRKKASECFYHFDHKTISNEIIIQIINILNKYNSISEGETEYILSLIYLTLNNKLRHMINSSETKNLAPMKLAVSAGMKFLQLNTDRNDPDPEELAQKNTLSASIISFLITATRYPPLYSDLFDEGNQIASYMIFKKIIYQDFSMFNEDYYIPIEIERTHLGMYLSILFETMEGYSCLKPYSFPFLRILIKIADVLSNCEDCTYAPINGDISPKFYTKLVAQANKRVFDKISNESEDYFTFKTNVYLNKSKINCPDRLEPLEPNGEIRFELLNQAISKNPKSILLFGEDINEVLLKIKSSAIASRFRNKGFTFEQVDENEEGEEKDYILPKYTIPELINEQIQFVMYYPNLFNFLIGKKSNLQDNSIYNDISRKFYSQLVDSEKVITLFYEYKRYGNIRTVIGDIKHFDNEIPYSNPLSKIVIHRLKKKNYESFLKASNLLFYQFNFKQESLVSNMNFENEKNFGELYGKDPKAKRRAMDENVNYPHIRSLVINAFLRCIYSVLISPSLQIRNDMLESLFIGDRYKNLLLYVSTQKYYSNFNFYYILGEIFKIENLKTIIDAHLYDPLREGDKKNTKISKFNSLIFPVLEHENFDNRMNGEINIFHTLYLTSIYLEKEISKHKSKGHTNYLFMFSFENTMHTFLNFYLQVNFKVIDEYFKSVFIVKRLCRKEHYYFIFMLNRQIGFHMTEAFNQLKEIKIKYHLLTSLLLASGIGEVAAIAKVIDDKEKSILDYLLKIDIRQRNLNELLSMLMMLDHKSENDIFYTTLGLYNEREQLKKRFEKQQKANTNTENIENKESPANNNTNNSKLNNTINSSQQNSPDNNNINDEEDEKEKKNEKKIISNIKKLTSSMRSLQFKKKILNEIKDENCIIILNSFCDVEIFSLEKAANSQFSFLSNKKVNTSFYMIMTNTLLYLFTYEASEDKLGSIQNDYIKISIDSIEKVIYFDYTRRIILQDEKDDKIAFLFPTNAFSLQFVDKIILLNKKIGIYKSTNISKVITAMENNDKITTAAFQEQVSKANNNTPESIAKAKTLIYSELKENFEKTKSFRVSNLIEDNIYGKGSRNLKLTNNVFYNEKTKDVLFFSQQYMYLIKEHLEQLNNITFNYFNDEVEIDPTGLWEIQPPILYEDITDVKNDFEEMKVDIYIGKGELKKEIHFQFDSLFEMYLINIQLCRIEKANLDKLLKKNKKKLKEISIDSKNMSDNNGSPTNKPQK